MSNESKHTPGPWVGIGRSVYAESNMEQPFVMVYQRDKSGEQCDANVRLIAAAPEMLEALERSTAELKDALREYDSYSVKCQIDQNEAIIKKAKGE